MADSFGIDDQVMGFAAFSVVDDIVDDILFVIVILFREKDILRAIGDTAPQCDISCIPAHNLDDAAAFMGGRGIPYLIDGLHGRIYSRIEAYGIIRACDVQITGPGKAFI